MRGADLRIQLCPSAWLGEAMWPKIPGRKTVGRPTGRRSRWDWPGSSRVPAVGWSIDLGPIDNMVFFRRSQINVFEGRVRR